MIRRFIIRVFADILFLVVAVDVQHDRRRVLSILFLFHYLSCRAQLLAYQPVRRCDHKYLLRYSNGDAIERVQCCPVSDQLSFLSNYHLSLCL